MNLYAAVKYVENEHNIPVYTNAPKKNILSISTDPYYETIKEENCSREIRLVKNKVNAFKKNIERRHPQEIENIRSSATRLLTSLNKEGEKGEKE